MLETFFSSINKSRIVSKKRSIHVDDVHPYLEDFDEEPQIFKRVFHLLSEPIWYYSMQYLGFYNICYALLTATKTVIDNEFIISKPDAFYLVDICWGIDLILRIISNSIPNLRSALIAPPARTPFVYAVEFIGILPFELLVQNGYLHNMFLLTRVLKVVNMVFLFHYINNKVNSSIYNEVQQLIFFKVLVIMISTFVLAVIVCKDTPDSCSKALEDNTLRFLLIAADFISTKGFGMLANESYKAKFWLTVISITCFVGITCIYYARTTFIFFLQATHKSGFKFKIKALKAFLAMNGMSQAYIGNVHDYYDMMWSCCDGYEGYMAETRRPYGSQVFKPFLPKAMNMEIQTDIFWSSFSHSTLFKDVEIAFLKELAVVMKQQIYITGQYVFHRDEIKDKMIYVFSGVIQLISEEDGATPLLSLGDGTCLAETSLLIPYKSTFKVQCLNTCTLQVLERSDFILVARKYPKIYKKLMATVRKRYVHAVYLHLTKSVINNKSTNFSNQSMSTIWINFTLHKLMSDKNTLTARKHAVQNIYLQNMVNAYTFKNLLFSARYLSLLAISERTQANSDTLFIKSTFPYILKDNTGFILFWNLFISSVALVASYKFPMICLISRGTLTTFYCWIYVVTIIWWIDVIVMLRTSVHLRHRVITNPMGILKRKLVDYHFLLDVLCCIPLELGSAVFVRKKSEDIVYMNRVLKIIRIFRLLRQWDKRYNSNPVLIRVITVSLVLFYLSILFSCIYNYVQCFNLCGIEELPKLVFYTSQIFTGVSLWVFGYTETDKYDLMNLVIFTAVSILHTLYYGLMFSAYTFNKLNTLNQRQVARKVIRVMGLIQPQVIFRIASYIKNQNKINHGLNLTEQDYFFKSMPKPLLGSYLQKQYISWITELDMFRGLPTHIVVDILQNSACVRYFSPKVILYYVGDLEKDIIILANGVCESVCGTDYKPTLINYKAALNDLEVYLNIPSRSTAMTSTHCEIIRINFINMKRVLLKYSDCSSMKCFVSMRSLRTKILSHPSYQTRTEDFQFRYTKQPPAIFHKKDPNYKRAYRRRGIGVLRFFLLPISFPPTGKFFFWWECFRCVCVVLSSLLFPTTGLIFNETMSAVGITLTVLDAISFLDIYVRMHVCYYDRRGILITHPLLTAIHYLNYGFLLDLAAAFPIYVIIPKNEYIYLTMTKLLQLHRYFGFFQYLSRNRVTPLPHYFKLNLLPIFIIMVNFGSSLLVALNCDIPENELTAQASCERVSIFGLNRMTTVFTPLTAHLYAFYATLSAVTTTSMQGFMIDGNRNMLLMGLFSVLGFYWSVWDTARRFGVSDVEIKKDVHLKHLQKFVSTYNVHKNVYKHVEAFLQRYLYMKRFNVHAVMVGLPKTIQYEMLYERYGKILTTSCLSSSKSITPFIRNLLMFSKYEIIEKEGYIITINDVLDETMIVFSGTVEVVAVDGKVILMLKPGSIIGNLCNMKYNRMITTFVASSTVELLTINTLQFYSCIENYPECYREFLRLRVIHGNHIPGTSLAEPMQHKKNTKVSFVKRKICIFWVNLILCVGCCLSQIIYLYQVAVSDFLRPKSIIINGLTDLSFLAAMIFELIMYMCGKPKAKSNRCRAICMYLKQRMCWLDIFAIIPFELSLFYLDFLTIYQKYYCFIVLRSHVLLRNFYLHRNISIYNFHMKTRLYITNLLTAIIILCIFTFAGTSLFMALTFISDSNMNYHIDRELLLNGNVSYRFSEFSNWFYVVSSTFTHTSQYKYFPVSWSYIAIMIVIMTLMMVLASSVNSQIFYMVHNSGQLKWEYKNRLGHLLSYLYHNETSQSLVDRVLYYSSVIWCKMEGFKYPSLLNLLPNYLRETLLYSAFGYAIESHRVFAKCHMDLKRQLATKLKIEYYFYGDYIQYKGIVDQTMYWVYSGEIVALNEASTYRDDISKTYTAGDAFGIPQGVFGNIPHIVSYRAISQTCVIYLQKPDWDYLMIFFPASKEIILQEGEIMRQVQIDCFKPQSTEEELDDEDAVTCL